MELSLPSNSGGQATIKRCCEAQLCRCADLFVARQNVSKRGDVAAGSKDSGKLHEAERGHAEGAVVCSDSYDSFRLQHGHPRRRHVAKTSSENPAKGPCGSLSSSFLESAHSSSRQTIIFPFAWFFLPLLLYVFHGFDMC